MSYVNSRKGGSLYHRKSTAIALVTLLDPASQGLMVSIQSKIVNVYEVSLRTNEILEVPSKKRHDYPGPRFAL